MGDVVPLPTTLAPRAPLEPASTAVARVSLADVLASRMQMHWFEVVAVAQGVCHAILLTARDSEPTAPLLSHVALTSLGTVEIRADVPTADPPVPFVRGILQAALPDNKPVGLRLFVLQLDPPSNITTLGELSTAIEYFERPDRAGLIREVVARYTANRFAPLEPTLEVERPKTTLTEHAERLARRRQPWLAAAVILAAAAALFGVGRWWQSGALGAKSQTSAASSLGTVLATTRTLAAGDLQGLAERIGLVSARRKSDAAVGKESLRDERHSRARPAVRRKAARDAPRASGVVVVAAPLVVAPPPIALAAREGSLVGEVLNDSGTVWIGAIVYDSRDADVTPPIELWPQLPTLHSGASPADTATFDLVIDESGNVRSARARVPLKSWDHVMLLSAMKAWRFIPARRDGLPVSYRKEVLVKVPIY
jgi:hypothetical protein